MSLFAIVAALAALWLIASLSFIVLIAGQDDHSEMRVRQEGDA